MHQPFEWNSLKPAVPAAVWIDRAWWVGLWLAALLLFTLHLGSLPLRDWDEGLVAQVAREIARSTPGSLTWLHPTLFGEPYFNKPPLVHWLIAFCYQLGGVQEWTTRLPGALLTSLSVPLLYSVGRELFPQRLPAIFAALVYLTTLPVVRHGRLAMLDGALLCFFVLLVVCLLRTRRDLRWGLGVGVAFGLLCLTKGIVALLLGAIVMAFVLWDTPRLLTTGYVWLGVALGCLPGVGWYGAQWWHYGASFFQSNLFDQSLNRVWDSVENNGGPVWYYLLELLKFGWPWLLFVPAGVRAAWENRNWGWAKLGLLWLGIYLLVVSLMSTKLPWYVLPVYPAIALLVGVPLAAAWSPSEMWGVPFQPRRYPIAWMVGLGLVAIVAWGGWLYLAILDGWQSIDWQIVLGALGLTLTVAAVLARRNDSQFIAVLLWGMYVSLLLLMGSQHWVWELEESYAVKPVANLIQRSTPAQAPIRTSYPYHRPSLNFYSDRRVVPLGIAELRTYWQQSPQPYLLLDSDAIVALSLVNGQSLGKAEGWTLLTRKADLSKVGRDRR